MIKQDIAIGRMGLLMFAVRTIRFLRCGMRVRRLISLSLDKA